MRNPAVAKAYAEITAAIAVLTGVVNGVAGESDPAEVYPEGDPLQELSEDCLDILTGAAGADAQLAGLKALTAATFVGTAEAAAPPDASPQAGRWRSRPRSRVP
ncbi:MAG: endonuclease [Pseudarthrobacter sp.]|nr:endonuclease [Pseudarthrobacter sp.]